MISAFTPDMPLAEIVRRAPAGVTFFHGHAHLGSFQILERAMAAFKDAQVKHFYIEISEKELAAPLKAHFISGGKSNDLDESFRHFINKNEMVHLKSLITAAHAKGIQVLAVDTNTMLNSGSHVAGDRAAADRLIRERVSHDPEIAALVRTHLGKLAPGDKYIGLFGRNHLAVGQILNATLVYLHAYPLEPGVTHHNAHPSQIEGTDEGTNVYLAQFHIVTMVPPNLEDSVDLSQPADTSKSLAYLNRLLEKFSLPPCQAYRHTNSDRISAAFFIKNEERSTVWAQVCSMMDPFAKRLDTTFDDTRTAIIFDDIEQDPVRQKIIASLVHLAKK